MPKYTVSCRGGLTTRSGLIPEGGTVEMSEKDADSLPLNTVKKLEEPKKADSKPEPKKEGGK